MSERHVVLARPGDVLILANVEGAWDAYPEPFAAMAEFFHGLDIPVVIFDGDVDMSQTHIVAEGAARRYQAAIEDALDSMVCQRPDCPTNHGMTRDAVARLREVVGRQSARTNREDMP